MPDEPLPRGVIELSNGFFNIRGSFKIGGVVEIGTQASLVQLASGRYVLLDACGLDAPTARWLDERTRGGEDLEAVLHLHPFHTLHVRSMHERYPKAALHGTARHHERLADLPWESLRTESPEMRERFAGELELSVPRGVELIPDDQKLHFASVLAFHPASRTLHVDDTLNYIRLPKLLRGIREDTLSFHPSLASVLERRAGAAREFRAWARELVERSRGLENLCAAHSAALVGSRYRGDPISTRIARALKKVEHKLASHERRHG